MALQKPGHCKAAALRHMVAWLVLVCREASDSNPDDRHSRWRLAFSERMQKADAVMRGSPRFMSEAATAAVAKLFGEAFEVYSALAASAAETEAERWTILPKHHAMMHTAYDNGCVKPRAAHCYDDEDMVGKMKRVYCKCHGVTASF